MITQIDKATVSGTNAERLAMNVTPGTFMAFYETDTNSEYEYKGSEWVLTKINGAVPVTGRMGGSFTSGTLANTTPVVVSLAGAPLPATVWVVPGAGDTVKVEYSCDGGTSYDTWPNGSVTARSKDTLASGATHLKFTATTDASHSSTYGVC